jgi:hypothetical protein
MIYILQENTFNYRLLHGFWAGFRVVFRDAGGLFRDMGGYLGILVHGLGVDFSGILVYGRGLKRAAQ